jgi:hypothetical protein
MNWHVSWIVTSLVLGFLAAVSVAIVEDVLRQRDVRVGASTAVYTLNDRYDTTVPEIVPGATVGQTFRATGPNLSRIELRLATYGRVNTAPLVLNVQEYPASGPPLRSVEADPGAIVDNFPYVFPFAPIADSAGKTFVVTLESPGARPDNAFTAFIGECDCYTGGTLVLNGEPQPDLDLTFRVGYENPPRDGALGEILNRMSQYKPRFFKGVALAALAFLAFASGMLAIGSFTSSLLADKDRRRSWLWVPTASAVIVAVCLWLVLR